MSKITINTELTEHKSILKFNSNHFLVNNETFTFNTKEEAECSPLAQALFAYAFVNTVYISQNFIAIKIDEDEDWAGLENQFTEQIEVYLNSEKPLLTAEAKGKKFPINLYTEMTPSVGALKFVCNKKLVINPVVFKYNEDSSTCALAQELFKFDYVKRISIAKNYLEITKGGRVEWFEVSSELREFIRSYLQSREPVVNEEYSYL